MNKPSRAWIVVGVILVIIGIALDIWDATTVEASGLHAAILGLRASTVGGACLGSGAGLAILSFLALRKNKQPPSN